MDFELSDEQSILRSMTGRYLADTYPFDSHRRHLHAGSRQNEALWRGLSELGLMAAPFPEDIGGHGGGSVDVMVIMAELGAALVPEPWMETVVLCGTLLRELGGGASLAALSAMIAHSHRVAFAHWEAGARENLSTVATRADRTATGWHLSGRKGLVVGADTADRLIVSARTSGDLRSTDGISLFIMPRGLPGLDVAPLNLIDGRACADLSFDGVALPAQALLGIEGQGFAAIAAAHDAATAASCAEAVGVLGRMLQDTLAYVRERRQFGQPLSKFQALQHRLVDMFIEVEMATSACHLACLNLGAAPDARAEAISAAKIVVNDALRFVGQNAVQLHGAMGLTEELAIGHYFKRATVLQRQFGTSEHHLARYGTQMRAKAASAA